MGLFECNSCKQPFHDGNCDQEKVRNRIEQLEKAAWEAERKLDVIQNSVFMVLQTLPTMENEQTTIPTEWLRKIWQAAECRFFEAKTADNFLTRWLVTHRILCEAFDLFKKSGTSLEKLTQLKTACDTASEVLEYRDARLDLEPIDIVRG